MQAVSAVLKGKYTMTGEAFDPVEVDMGRSAANNITQSGGTGGASVTSPRMTRPTISKPTR